MIALALAAACATTRVADQATPIASVVTAGTDNARASRTSLEFDGAYQSEPETVEGLAMWHYLRFYPDGRVVSASSTGRPSQVAAWLSFDRTDLARGRFVEDGSALAFATHSAAADVDYRGTVDTGGSLTLRLRTPGGYEATRRYAFVGIRFAR